MTRVHFLGGPKHGEQQNFSGKLRPLISVHDGTQRGRLACYVYYSPTASYVIAAYSAGGKIGA